jgi:endonuclease/exonuclease/phosphatase family metal-dependent hydrolase
MPKSGRTALSRGSISVMTFNIHADTLASRILDGLNSWPRRRERVVRVIAESGCDVIGLQESVQRQWEYLTYALSDVYESYAVGSDGGLKGEIMPLYWKRDRFDLIDHNTFWLNEGLVPGDRMPGAKRTRICSWVKLRDKSNMSEFTVYNSHLDHRHGPKGQEIRSRSAGILIEQIGSRGFNRSILLGDFNCLPGSLTCSVLSRNLTDSYEALARIKSCDRPPTFHRGDHGFLHIDFVYCSPDIQVNDYEIVCSHGGTEKIWPSDHYPVKVELAY